MRPARVQLLVTCLVDRFFPGTGESVVRVLERAGVAVTVPAGQTCCGQPAFNAGYDGEARALARHTIDVLSASDDPVVVPSGSCGDMVIHQYVALLGDDPEYGPEGAGAGGAHLRADALPDARARRHRRRRRRRPARSPTTPAATACAASASTANRRRCSPASRGAATVRCPRPRSAAASAACSRSRWPTSRARCWPASSTPSRPAAPTRSRSPTSAAACT